MTTMTLADLADRRAVLDEQIERLTQEKALVNEKIFEITQAEPGNYGAGDYTVQIKAGAKRLDEKKFAERFPVAQYPNYYKPVPDISAIKEYIAPVELERFQVQNKPSVGVK